MLRLRGKDMPENTELLDQEFLMKIMEKNEEVESAETEEEIMKLNEENKAVIKDLQKQLSRAFFDGDLKRVEKLLSYMKYYTSIDNQIQAAIPNSQYELRVIQGKPTTIDRFPILAQLLLDTWGNNQYIQHCAGVILTSRHVISTAHCFQYSVNTGRNYSLPIYWRIRVGSSYRTRGGFIHNIKTIVPHPDFDKFFYTNDIAVIVVTKPFIFGKKVKQGTILKYGAEVMPNSVCTLVGWGVLEPDGVQPDQLQRTNLFSIDQSICRMRYATIRAPIADSMICAGRVEAGGPDGCYGDSGGPLIYKGVVLTNYYIT
ncbi:hypothetical protein O3G_MSEX005710 [Manduca sexta]|uniref:Peptidase S1 domain-containing protein n=1 Tax=Manduca sexta TaxID=7130 RepID=A0A921Z1X7_MANSE|nr:hypothetical protein O3G_MSEX005710 [Manduca sexta]